jgi:hypothetical protein
MMAAAASATPAKTFNQNEDVPRMTASRLHAFHGMVRAKSQPFLFQLVSL